MAQAMNKAIDRTLHHEIEIQQPTPGVAMNTVEEEIADGATHESDTPSSCRVSEGRPESRGIARHVHSAAQGWWRIP